LISAVCAVGFFGSAISKFNPQPSGENWRFIFFGHKFFFRNEILLYEHSFIVSKNTYAGWVRILSRGKRRNDTIGKVILKTKYELLGDDFKTKSGGEKGIL